MRANGFFPDKSLAGFNVFEKKAFSSQSDLCEFIKKMAIGTALIEINSTTAKAIKLEPKDGFLEIIKDTENIPVGPGGGEYGYAYVNFYAVTPIAGGVSEAVVKRQSGYVTDDPQVGQGIVDVSTSFIPYDEVTINAAQSVKCLGNFSIKENHLLTFTLPLSKNILAASVGVMSGGILVLCNGKISPNLNLKDSGGMISPLAGVTTRVIPGVGVGFDVDFRTTHLDYYSVWTPVVVIPQNIRLRFI